MASGDFDAWLRSNTVKMQQSVQLLEREAMMATGTAYTTHPIFVPSLVEAVKLRAARIGRSEKDTSSSLGDEVYRRWARDTRKETERRP